MTILQPLVVLAGWTMVMWLWMYATRIPAMQAAQVDPDGLARNPEKKLKLVSAPHVQWKAHNYNHLHEAPTVFYAVVLALALLGQGNGEPLWLAWLYVCLRVAHSLVQVTVNKVMLRWVIFTLSSIVLLALIILAAIAAFAA